MGRKKLKVEQLADEKQRQATFQKRKSGIMKKAYELSVLCDCEVALIFISPTQQLVQYASSDMDKVLLRYTNHKEPVESRNNQDFEELMERKGLQAITEGGDDDDGDSPEHSFSEQSPVKANDEVHVPVRGFIKHSKSPTSPQRPQLKLQVPPPPGIQSNISSTGSSQKATTASPQQQQTMQPYILGSPLSFFQPGLAGYLPSPTGYYPDMSFDGQQMWPMTPIVLKTPVFNSNTTAPQKSKIVHPRDHDDAEIDNREEDEPSSKKHKS